MQKPADPVLVFIRQYIVMHGFPPTQREISCACNLTLSATNKQILKLSLAGRIEYPPNQARGVGLPKGGDPLPPAV